MNLCDLEVLIDWEVYVFYLRVYELMWYDDYEIRAFMSTYRNLNSWTLNPWISVFYANLG